MDTVAEIRALVSEGREQHQVERELRACEERIERTYKAIRDVASFGGVSILNPLSKDMLAAVVSLQSSVINDDRSITDSHLRIMALEPEQLVACVYKSIMDLTSDLDGNINFSTPANTFYRRVGVLVEMTARMNMLKYVKKGAKKPQDNTPLVQLSKEYSVTPSTLARWKGKQLHACMRDVGDTKIMHTGKLLVDAVFESIASILYCRKVNTKGAHMQFRIGLLESVVEQMETEAADRAFLTTALGFMVCEPNPLTSDSINARDRYLTRLTTERANFSNIQPSEQTIEAANSIQAVPYAVNQKVFQLFMTLSDDTMLTLASLQDMPTQPNDGESQRQFESRLHNIDISNRAKTNSLQLLKEAATEALNYERIWFPVFLDFRGRQYAVDYKGLGPQATKNAKALLQLANGTPLGPNGLWWLYHELGNSMGWDKDLLEDKVAKAKALLPRMRGILANPMSDTVWLEGDDPLKVYACMADIVAAIDSGKPEEFVSHLICYVDGSCNGMQHLSLMTLDEVGAAATNVISNDGARSDFYSIVGDRMLDALEDDYSDAAMYWKTTACEKFGMRKVAKRGVMTIPYGATHAGLATQFIEDNLCTTKERGHKQTQQESLVIRDALEVAMDGAAPKAMELRQWMLDAVTVVCKSNASPSWITPTGSLVNHRYLSPRTKQVRIGDFATNLPDFSGKGATINTRKNKLGIVANLIHSYDAAMLQDTANRMVANNVTELSFVHDSYGAGAGAMDVLSTQLREAAVAMYSVDQLGLIKARFEELAGTELPPLPAPGKLNLSDVMASEYFFA
jgi:hypothetical protein